MFLSSCTNHLTLAHRAISIAIKTKKWTLPFVRYADQVNAKKSRAKAQSTASKKEGCKEEPGFRTKEKNPDTVGSDSDDMAKLEHSKLYFHWMYTNTDQQHNTPLSPVR